MYKLVTVCIIPIFWGYLIVVSNPSIKYDINTAYLNIIKVNLEPVGPKQVTAKEVSIKPHIVTYFRRKDPSVPH